MKIRDLLYELEVNFPLDKQEPWDHSGLQLGNIENECDHVLICLNVDENTIQQAIENKCQLIISHHPFLFHSINTIDLTTVQGNNIKELITHDITVYSMHTNYDALRMNEMLLEKIECIHIESIDESGITRVGDFRHDVTFEDLIQKFKNLFQLKYVRVCGTIPKKVKTIALCAGSGHDYIDIALQHADVYITGDLTYSHAMDIILRKDGCVIELPHFIEEAFKEDIIKYLSVNTILAKEFDYFEII